MTIAVLVILAGALVGLAIDVVITRRHRARRVAATPPGDAMARGPESVAAIVEPDDIGDDERRGREEGVIILGPIERDHRDVPSIPWDLEHDPFHDDPFETPPDPD